MMLTSSVFNPFGIRFSFANSINRQAGELISTYITIDPFVTP